MEKRKAVKPEDDWKSVPDSGDWKTVAEIPLEEVGKIPPTGSPIMEAVKRYLSNFGKSFDPRPLTQIDRSGPIPRGPTNDPTIGAVNMGFNLLKGMGAELGRVQNRAFQAAKSGDIPEAISSGIAGLIPGIGPMAVDLSDQMRSGDIAGGLGGLTGAIAAPLAFGKAARIINGMNLPKLANAQARAQALTSGLGQLRQVPKSSASTTLQSGKNVRIGLAEDVAGGEATTKMIYDKARRVADLPENSVDVQVGTKKVPQKMTEGSAVWFEEVEQPVTKKMGLPVDISPIQMQVKALIEEIEAQPLGKQSTGRVYGTLKKLADGPSKVPFADAIDDVSVLGKAGFSHDPLISSRADGIARTIWRPYHDALDATAQGEATGQVFQALQEGRAAYKQLIDTKQIARQVMKTPTKSGRFVPKEPVRIIRGLTVADDAAVEMLESLAETSPQTIPDVARGYLSDVLNQATKKGGFNGMLAFEKWASTGQRTKEILFGRNQGLQNRLDPFFQAAKLAGDTETTGNLFSLEKAATEGGGFRAVVRNTKGSVEYYMTSKSIERLLYTKSGADLLTRALTTPASGAGAKALGNLIYINSVLPSNFKKTSVPAETY